MVRLFDLAADHGAPVLGLPVAAPFLRLPKLVEEGRLEQCGGIHPATQHGKAQHQRAAKRRRPVQDADLAAHQAQGWGPWLDWAGSDLGAPLQVARGIMPVMQPQASLDALGAVAATHDDWELGMLYRATTLGGSLVLGLAMLRGRMDAAALFEAAFLDELWQAQKWGSDWEAEDRRAMIRGEIEQAHHFLSLLRDAG